MNNQESKRRKKLFPVVFLLLTFFLLPIFFYSCSSGCDGNWYHPTEYFTFIRLDDSTNYFEEIRHTDFDAHFKVRDTYLDSNSFYWNLRISKPVTTMLIKTRNRGWDTLIYSMKRSYAMYTEPSECFDEGVRMKIDGPIIESSTFDTAYFQDISSGNYATYGDRVLFVK